MSAGEGRSLAWVIARAGLHARMGGRKKKAVCSGDSVEKEGQHSRPASCARVSSCHCKLGLWETTDRMVLIARSSVLS